jgi:hypothetical protein
MKQENQEIHGKKLSRWWSSGKRLRLKGLLSL